MTHKTELDFLYETVNELFGKTVGRDAVWQIAPVACSIPFAPDCISNLEKFESELSVRLPELRSYGLRRANKAFVRECDTITKPSYIGRLIRGQSWGMGQSQMDTLAQGFVREPLSGGLVFSVFHPKDSLDRRRPGYVPCLVAGSFVLHRGQLHLNAFFRSQSIVEFGIYDLLFLRRFQSRFIDSVSRISRDKLPKRMQRQYRLSPGPLNLHFGRVVVPGRIARSRTKSLRRAEVVRAWLGLLVEVIEATHSRPVSAPEKEDHFLLPHQRKTIFKQIPPDGVFLGARP